MCCMMMHPMDHSTRDTEHGHSHPATGEPLLDIVNRRYALGEITREQLQEMKSVLALSTGPVAPEAAHN